MSDYYSDLTGSDDERSNLYKSMILELEQYNGFFVYKYDDIDKVRLETEKILDSIINILLNYLDKKVVKVEYVNEIKILIYDKFRYEQPQEIKIPDNNKLFLNHYLFYVKRKLDDIKSIISR